MTESLKRIRVLIEMICYIASWKCCVIIFVFDQRHQGSFLLMCMEASDSVILSDQQKRRIVI